MAVRRALEKQPPPHQYDLDELLDRGAKVKEDNKIIAEPNHYAHINLRVPEKLLKELSICLKDRVGISRTGWILEAIHEKLQKQKKSGD